ncbi:DUF4249 family protein [Cryomorpha ignava]|uniref:DUF4249 family protein n=1 Tax=Cryomorpha ignava TaxID=101383 RepID=A0A7K3WUS1_9FLAO|nr:DUF4249 family protein [Cryomorpha ignava]NEN24801.1 DUF4249 family protein [Cryomorpha ignava]
MKINVTIFLVLIFSLLLSCEKAEEEANKLDSKILIECYVFANEPVIIRAASVNENGHSVSSPAENAEVKLIQGNVEIPFAESDTLPGTYYQTNLTTILADTGLIKLSVNYKGHEHSSQATFPPQLSGLAISTADIELLPGEVNTTIATISWTPLGGAVGYCIFLRNVADYPALQINNNLYNSQQSHFSKIIYETSVNLKSADFAYIGDYDIYVTAIGSEYLAMYNGYGLNNLISAPSNIENGWGVFTAFNGQAVAVTVQ